MTNNILNTPMDTGYKENGKLLQIVNQTSYTFS
jgi:hypothetical protein